MNYAHTLGRLASRTSEDGLLIRFRSRETEDAIDESLFEWRDSQASRFASAIHDPQRQAFPAMQSQLSALETCLTDLCQIGERAEVRAARVRSDGDAVLSLCVTCESKVRNAEHHVAEARIESDQARKRAGSICSGVTILGQPPV